MPDGPLTPLANLRCRTDANGYLIVSAVGGGGGGVGTFTAIELNNPVNLSSEITNTVETGDLYLRTAIPTAGSGNSVGAIFILPGDGGNEDRGGEVIVRGGASIASDGGRVQLFGGDSMNSAGGDVRLNGGSSTNDFGGSAYVYGGGGKTGGTAYLQGGNSLGAGEKGGNVQIIAGTGPLASGRVFITGADILINGLPAFHGTITNAELIAGKVITVTKGIITAFA